MAEPLLGFAEIAARLAKQLVDAGAAEHVQCVQRPPSLNSPSAPIALRATRGGTSHVLALVDWWDVLVAAPPKLSRATRVFERQTFREYDFDELGRWLVELCRAWWADASDEVGLFDVLLALDDAATTSLGVARGAFSQTLSHGPQRDPALTATIGRARGHPHAAALLSLRTGANGVEAGGFSLRTTPELSAALPALLHAMRTDDDAQHRWLAAVSSLDALAAEVRRLTPLRWASHPPWSVNLSVEPFLTLTAPARVGGTMSLTLVAGPVARVKVAGLPVPLDVLPAVLSHETCLVRASRLVERARYVVLEPFSAAPESGAVVTFHEAQDRHGVDAFVFSSGALVIDDAASEQVLARLHEHLALALTTPQLERGRYRLQRALTDADGQRWAAGTVVTIDALTYQPHDDGWTLRLAGGRALRLLEEAVWSPA